MLTKISKAAIVALLITNTKARIEPPKTGKFFYVGYRVTSRDCRLGKDVQLSWPRPPLAC